MTIENAFVIKGYFIAEPPPKQISDALDSVIVSLRYRNSDIAEKPPEIATKKQQIIERTLQGQDAKQIAAEVDTSPHTVYVVRPEMKRHEPANDTPKPNPRAWSDEDKATALRLRDDGMGGAEIGRALGRSAAAVYTFFNKLKPHEPHAPENDPPQIERSAKAGWTEEQKATALRMYAEGKSNSEIGKAIGKSTGLVYQWLYARKNSHPAPAVLKPINEPAPPAGERIINQHKGFIGKRTDGKLHDSDWPDIRQMLLEGSHAAAAAERYGVPPDQMQEFIRRMQVRAAKIVAENSDGNEWSQEDMETVRRMRAENRPLREIARAVKRHTGSVMNLIQNMNAATVDPALATTQIDPATGLKITKCPPAYAMGAQPQRNLGHRL
jgi:transposase-like protein